MVPANQGSRGALVTWTVVTTILFVTATIFAIYFYVAADNTAREARTTAEKFKKVVSEAALTSNEVAALEQTRNDETMQAAGFNSSMSLLDVALKQRDDLATRLSGSIDFGKAIQSSDRVLKDAAAKATAAELVNLPSGNANAAVGALADALVSKSSEIANLRTELASAQGAAKEAANQMTIAREAMDKQLAEVRASAAEAMDAASTDRSSKNEQVSQIQTDFQAQLESAQQATQSAQVQIADLQRDNEQLKTQIQQLTGRLVDLRTNVSDPIVRQADGTIIRLASADTVYINLGQGDQISAGMTFQVFDKVEGVPAAGDSADETNLPRGKASIEVVRVGPTSSQARIIRLQPGQTLTEGDLLVNLVYDRNTRYNFLVFGNFDPAWVACQLGTDRRKEDVF
ncbi:MAG TPA: hypothetical protein PLD59_15470, partial [Tepidisphaeraceae bacterium]|nr:hypothetical protein [Tepidisphaeraceae bacterium]